MSNVAPVLAANDTTDLALAYTQACGDVALELTVGMAATYFEHVFRS